jgi:CRISPR/Cas system-associated exonuclease Cas4 (RecB family)
MLLGRLSGERLLAQTSDRLKPAASKWLETAANLLTERQFPRTPNSKDCDYCCFKPVCGDGAYNQSLLRQLERRRRRLPL